MTIENARITSTSISMADHGVLCISFGVKGDGWGCSIGQYMNGVGHLGALKWKANDNEKDFMIEISSYETISINGEDYNTDEVTSVTSHPGVYEEDAYEIILKDGTKVRFSANGYTLKDKK